MIILYHIFSYDTITHCLFRLPNALNFSKIHYWQFNKTVAKPALFKITLGPGICYMEPATTIILYFNALFFLLIYFTK